MSVEGAPIGAAIGSTPGALNTSGLIPSGEIGLIRSPSLGTATLDSVPRLDFGLSISSVGTITPVGSTESIPTPNAESIQALSVAATPKLEGFTELIIPKALPGLSRDRMMPKLDGSTISAEYSILARGKQQVKVPDSFQGTLVGDVTPVVDESLAAATDTMLGTFLPDSPDATLSSEEVLNDRSGGEDHLTDLQGSDFVRGSLDSESTPELIDAAPIRPNESMLGSFPAPETEEGNSKETPDPVSNLVTSESVAVSQAEAEADKAQGQRVKELMIQVGFAESQADSVIEQVRTEKAERLGIVEVPSVSKETADTKVQKIEDATLETTQTDQSTSKNATAELRIVTSQDIEQDAGLDVQDSLAQLEDALFDAGDMQTEIDEVQEHKVPIIAEDINQARKDTLVAAANTLAEALDDEAEEPVLDGKEIVEEAAMSKISGLKSPIVHDGEDHTIGLIEKDLLHKKVKVSEVAEQALEVVEDHAAVEEDVEPEAATPEQVAEVLGVTGIIVDFKPRVKNSVFDQIAV